MPLELPASPGPIRFAMIVLECVDQLVADHVIGFGHGRRQRQHDAALRHLRDAAGAFAERAFDDVGLLEVGMRGVQHQRLHGGKLRAPRTCDSRAYQRSAILAAWPAASRSSG